MLSLLLQLQLALAVQAFVSNGTAGSATHSSIESLRIAFAPHPFLSHWAVSAPIAQELLQRGHKVLVRATTRHVVSERFLGTLKAC